VHNQKSYTPLDLNDYLDYLTAKYAQLFHHDDFGWIYADNNLKPNWQTISTHQLSIGELIRLFHDYRQLIGVGFSQQTKYGLIDIDWSSKYHPAHDSEKFQKLLQTLETIGLTRYIVLQSSYSQGIHVYLPLPDKVGTFHLAAAIRVTLADVGIELKNGQVEIFPNTKSFAKAETGGFSNYKRHRLPLQPESGSYLLEDDGLNPQPIEASGQLEAFLDQWEWASAGQDMELLHRKLPQLYAKYKHRKNRYKYQSDEERSKKARIWLTDLDLTISVGWTDKGKTYNLLPKFLAKGVVFLELKGKELFEWMYTAITNAPGYQQYCGHKHEIEKLIWSWIKTNDRTQYYTPYQSEPNRNQPYPFGSPKRAKKKPRQINPANKRLADLAAHRIRTAVGCLRDKFTPDLKIGEWQEMIRDLIQKLFEVSCSNNTLTRHKSIWHPKYSDLLTTLPQTEENAPEDIQTDEISPCIDISVNRLENEQTESGENFHQLEPLMIGIPLELLPNSNNPPLPRAEHHEPETGITTTARAPGKFEVLAGALSKMIGIAAIVINIGLAAGIATAESTVAVYTNPSATNTQFNEPALVSTNSNTNMAQFGAGESESEIIDQTVLADVPPCQDPRIPSMRITRYNPNQIGVPWTTADEFYKFLGYLVIVAKQDKSIKNPHAWAVKSIKNLKERGINSHWLTFTGQKMVDPHSPEAEFLRGFFRGATPSPTNFTNRRAEPILSIVEQAYSQPSQQPPTFPMVEVEVEQAYSQPSQQPPTFPMVEVERAYSQPSQQPPTSPMVEVERVYSQPTKQDSMDSSPEPTPIAPTENGHQHSQHNRISCPKCQIPAPAVELERWDMCAFCARKIYAKRVI
jgi:hypothetical protein